MVKLWGRLGLVVEVIVRCQDLEVVTILLLQMVVLTVLAAMKKTNLAQEEDAKSMEVGVLGLHGQAVEMIARCHDREVVTIQHLPMEDLTVWVKVKKIKLALKVKVKKIKLA